MRSKNTCLLGTNEKKTIPAPWAFGNTTVRNPLRIRSGLAALQDSPLNGYLIGKEQEKKFADLLNQAGVVEIKDGTRDYSDMGRKWRSCFSQLGLITHKFSRKMELGEREEIILQASALIRNRKPSGRPYELTPSGERLIKAETYPQQQECFLRVLLAYEIPSAIELTNGDDPFKPFYFVLQVLTELLSQTHIGINTVEMAFLQGVRTHEPNDIKSVVDEIAKFRKERGELVGTVAKRAFDRDWLGPLADNMGIQPESLRDYADTNFRYLRVTGLFSYQGSRLVLNAEKKATIDAILKSGPDLTGMDSIPYLARLWEGAALPTDDEMQAVAEIDRYKNLLIGAGVRREDLPQEKPEATIADLTQIRLLLEEQHQEMLELAYAKRQGEEFYLSETIAYLKKLDNQRNEETSAIEKIDDKAAYLEWAVWRAFLAFGSHQNLSYEARRFRVDQDFYPIGCAPGRGPDMIFHFKDFALVIEVTLTSSSRQEAAEGEPVRRHVAIEKGRIEQEKGIPVYGLFLAGNIDNNTAETFRIGVWYQGDNPEFINIVPLTLSQFIQIMEMFRTCRFSVSRIRRLLDACLIPRNAHAPAWKVEIEKSVQRFCQEPVNTKEY